MAVHGYTWVVGRAVSLFLQTAAISIIFLRENKKIIIIFRYFSIIFLPFLCTSPIFPETFLAVKGEVNHGWRLRQLSPGTVSLPSHTQLR